MQWLYNTPDKGTITYTQQTLAQLLIFKNNSKKPSQDEDAILEGIFEACNQELFLHASIADLMKISFQLGRLYQKFVENNNVSMSATTNQTNNQPSDN